MFERTANFFNRSVEEFLPILRWRALGFAFNLLLDVFLEQIKDVDLLEAVFLNQIVGHGVFS